jgi:hypothetical protein
MKTPPLQPLHHTSLLSRVKLDQYARLTTAELLKSLAPGEPGSLKVRSDGTILDGHHRIVILRERGVDVDQLPREILTGDWKSNTSGET